MDTIGPGELSAILMIFGGITSVLLSPVFIVRMILKHREKLTAMKYRQEGAPGLLEEVEALRQELRELRDITTKYDISFDSAINRLEERVQDLEGGRRNVGSGVTGAPASDSETLYRRTGG